ncbi:hypothetical protein [Alkalihalobacterium bogoriense]|uniref:hypothetical protein n=1 Tax=Alkalihalobacterium bogoriense TaxID=246272 RepID=UPI000478EBF6|nr:hypothetical protein [Alkalihalobacterium bogoriense]
MEHKTPFLFLPISFVTATLFLFISIGLFLFYPQYVWLSLLFIFFSIVILGVQLLLLLEAPFIKWVLAIQVFIIAITVLIKSMILAFS